MKQYFITEAYTDNYHVVRCNDGKIESDKIVAYYELEGYTSALEDMGYTEAFYIPQYEKEMLEAKNAYERAKKAYEMALENPLKVNSFKIHDYFNQ